MESKEDVNLIEKKVFEKKVNDEKQDDIKKIVDTVVQTWELVNKDALKHGKVFYKRLFTTHPDVISLFSFSSEVSIQMDESSGLRNQAYLLMSMIDYAVSQLGNLSELIPKLKSLGARHFIDYHVKPEHFKPVGECLLWTLKVGLGELFTTDVERAWTVIYTMLADVMIEGGKSAMENGSV